jgi:hypothetical protein
MAQPRRRSRLAAQPGAGAGARQQVAAQPLDGHPPSETLVKGLVDLPHAAATEDFLEAVGAEIVGQGEGGGYLGRILGHRARLLHLVEVELSVIEVELEEGRPVVVHGPRLPLFCGESGFERLHPRKNGDPRVAV